MKRSHQFQALVALAALALAVGWSLPSAAAIPGPLGADAHQILADDAFRTGLAKRWYQDLLGRAPKAAESSQAVERVRAGKPGFAAMIAAIAGGDDYFRKAGSTYEAFVGRLFQDLIGRAPDPKDELPGALDFLKESQRSELVDVLTDTDDFRLYVTGREYRHFLGRAATEDEQTAGAAELKDNGVEELTYKLLTSEEYFTKRGGATENGWRLSVFRDLLIPAPSGSGGPDPGRNAPSPGGNPPPPNRGPITPGSPGSRDQIVSSLLTRPEYLTGVVNAVYRRYLKRGATDDEVERWLPVLEQAGSSEQIVRGILTSDEYFEKAGGSMKLYRSRLSRDLLGEPGGGGARESSTRDKLIDLFNGLRRKKPDR